MIIAIDASNIKDRGGLKHILELINNVDISRLNVTKVLIYGGSQLDHLPEKEWLEKKKVNLLMKGNFFFESIWKLFYAEKEFLKHADIVFAPGGTFYSRKIPYVAMSQNMLVFETKESRRYGFSWVRLRLLILKKLQSRSFKGSNGIIFISNYAFNYITNLIPAILNKSKVIYFGSSNAFDQEIKVQKNISEYSIDNPFKILYVSILDVYKHQDVLVRAIEILKKKDYPIELVLVGPKYQPFYKKYLKEVSKLGDISFINYVGQVQYKEVYKNYKQADIFVFASSCENMPNILIEAMASGLPVACSYMGPMPEFLRAAGEYFDPLSENSIAEAIERLILNPALRYNNALKAKSLVQEYSWKKCASETFEFIIKSASLVTILVLCLDLAH